MVQNKDETLKAAFTLANSIASKSPVAITGSLIKIKVVKKYLIWTGGIKRNLLYTRDHSVDDGLK